MLNSDIPKIGFVSLGCAKALVDSERILTQLKASGYAIVDSYDAADLVVVNTCGFLNSAIDESMGAIEDALGIAKNVIAIGCLGSKHDLLKDRFPGLKAIHGPHKYEEVLESIHKILPRVHDPKLDLVPKGGIKLTPRHYAYLKIAEGCNQKCKFCIIPQLRGKLSSYSMDSIFREAEDLAIAGVKELMVVSQDTGAYGRDLGDKESNIVNLCEKLGSLRAWIRLHYLYPYPVVSKLVELMADNKILPYLDMPLQHASPKILKSMRRPSSTEKVLDRLVEWRKIVSDLSIRSTFIVGYPGETEEDFEFLLDWLKEAKIDRAGCFMYENVNGAESSLLPDHVPEELKKERWQQFMQVQESINENYNISRIGTRADIIIDSEDENCYIGRTKQDSPDVDGIIIIPKSANTKAQVGTIVPCKITHASKHNLQGTIL